MEPVSSKNIKRPVIFTKILNNSRLVVADADTTIRYIDLNTINLLNGFKMGIKHLRYKTDLISFSKDGKFFATITSDLRESQLFDTMTKKIIGKVNRHHGEISCVGIDNNAQFMFSCGDDGKTFAIDTKSGKLAFTLPIHSDTVNDIAFSQNSNWLATASYDRKVSLFNLSMMTPKHKFMVHQAPVMKLRFLNQSRVISIDKDAVAIIWSLYSSKVIKRLEGVHDDVTQIATSTNDEFLFLGTALGYVIVYDLKTYEVLSKKYIKLKTKITAMEFHKETNILIIGCENGDILFYNIYEGEDELKELLKKKEYEEIQKRSEVNPLLAYTKIYKLVANLWEKVLAQAIICLENGDKKTAIGLFTHFKSIPSKNKIIQQVIIEYEHFDQFAMYAKQGKIPLAYGLANKHPMYKNSKIYKSLELRWQKSFVMAQKYSLDPKGAEKAKEVLAPYRGLSEKTKLIQELLTQGEVYKRFRVAIGQKDFKIAFELIRHHPFLMEFPEYLSIMKYGDTLYIKSQEYMKDGDTHSAVKMLRVLADFDDFEDEVKTLMIEIESKEKFFNAVEEEDEILAYNLMSISEDLVETEDGKRLQEKWTKALNASNTYAADGDIVSISKTLEDFLKISSKYMSLATIYGWCYMVQLENAVKSKEDKVVIENGIKNYILCFGVQDQIESFFHIFMKYYPSSKLNLELLTKGSLSMWRPSMIVDSILD